MGLLEGRTVLVTGVTMHTSIAFKAAQIAQDEGARVIVSNLPRAVGVTRRAVRKLANPKTALGGKFLETEWDDVSVAVHTSTYSYVSLMTALVDILAEHASVVGLTFDATVSWPFYDWMGVAKAGLESANRYLARYLGPKGVRCNLVSAGPLDTMAKTAIPGADAFNDVWGERAPLGWDTKDTTPAAKGIVALLSDWFPATTGEIIHVDGGMGSTGA